MNQSVQLGLGALVGMIDPRMLVDLQNWTPKNPEKPTESKPHDSAAWVQAPKVPLLRALVTRSYERAPGRLLRTERSDATNGAPGIANRTEHSY